MPSSATCNGKKRVHAADVHTPQKRSCEKRRLEEHRMKNPRQRIISTVMQVCKDSSKASVEGKPPVA